MLIFYYPASAPHAHAGCFKLTAFILYFLEASAPHAHAGCFRRCASVRIPSIDFCSTRSRRLLRSRCMPPWCMAAFCSTRSRRLLPQKCTNGEAPIEAKATKTICQTCGYASNRQNKLPFPVSAMHDTILRRCEPHGQFMRGTGSHLPWRGQTSRHMVPISNPIQKIFHLSENRNDSDQTVIILTTAVQQPFQPSVFSLCNSCALLKRSCNPHPEHHQGSGWSSHPLQHTGDRFGGSVLC